MVYAHRYWIWIWYAILAIGSIGFLPALQWGRQTNWRNLDEVLRAFGTICASIGMLLLLKEIGGAVGYALLVIALVVFITAFVWGRHLELERKKSATPTSAGG